MLWNALSFVFSKVIIGAILAIGAALSILFWLIRLILPKKPYEKWLDERRKARGPITHGISSASNLSKNTGNEDPIHPTTDQAARALLEGFFGGR